ncbi:nicastrin isoform X1 [Cucumis melo]|uniref:Nicastrin n=1 Tax=Cucumis melo TaxID=3656 RepID=A0A1S3C4C7_CUCME|nr:nicastrin isoform X1 [Cucumis melo]
MNDPTDSDLIERTPKSSSMSSQFLYLLLFLTSLRLSSSDEQKMESVPDLQNSMYLAVDGYPCIRLLNLSGEIGCSNPGREKVVLPMINFKDADEILEPSAVLVSMDAISSFFTRLQDDSHFANNVGGVLIEPGTGIQNRTEGFSPAQKFPQAKFAPYKKNDYEWNPIGSGIMWNRYNFPVFLISESSISSIQEAASKNVKSKKDYVSNVAEFDLVMQTTKAGTHSSMSCLKEETCLPLGGYSVWSSLPPINTSSSDQSKPVILTVASMDSASFFRDKSIGADSPISGLIALLAAVDALSHVDGLDDLHKQLVFVVFTGESWGYLGSRRFLLELDLQSDAVSGLSNRLIDMVFEIGSVGKSSNHGSGNFFAHMTEVSSSKNETWNALKLARESLPLENIKVSPASTTNPGIPPSSLMAFLAKNPQISGVVLDDFDTGFTNQFYQSHLDDLHNINSSAIEAAALLVARTLYILAINKNELSSSVLTAIKVNTSLVEELIGCLLNCDPGLSCELVKRYITPSSVCPNHYVGVILDEPSSAPYPDYVHDVSRFVWNFLADRTSIPKENTSSVCSQNCDDRSEVCIGAETGKGTCVISTTRYIPAYSTRLKFESGYWSVLPPNSSDHLGAVDPVWTESNWNTIGLRIYTIQAAAYDRFVLLGGITTTILAYFAIVAVRSSIIKALKRD